jgi:hypothetical protein
MSERDSCRSRGSVADMSVAQCPLRSESDRIDASQRSAALCHVWTAPSWQGFSSRLQAGRCSHVFGLLARHTRPLAIMPSADQVPVKSPHSRCTGTSGLS